MALRNNWCCWSCERNIYVIHRKNGEMFSCEEYRGSGRQFRKTKSDRKAASERRKATLLSEVSPETYSAISDLVASAMSKSIVLEEIF